MTDMSDPHTLRSFDTALNDLVAAMSKMGRHVSLMSADCARIFLDRDPAAAKHLIEADLEVDRHKELILHSTVDVLARLQPVASDLRLVLAIEHSAGDLERVADHAKNIAKRTLTLSGSPALDTAIGDLITRLHKAVQGMLEDALYAAETRDEKLAAEVHRRDREPDAIYDDLFHSVVAKIQTDPKGVAGEVQALFVGKSLERIGDHATNIAEEIRFLTGGGIPSATRQR